MADAAIRDGEVRARGRLLHRDELPRVAGWALLITLLILSPYVVAGSLAGPDRVFAGHLYNVLDSNAYLAWMNQAAHGEWRFENKYAREGDRRLFSNAFLLAMGKLAGALRLRPIGAWHIARVVGGWFCLVGIYLLAAFFFEERAERWATLLIAAFSSGLGWLFFAMGLQTHPMPFDFGLRSLIQPEAITYLSIYVNPLFAFSIGLMCVTFLLFLLGMEDVRYGRIVAAGLCGLLLGNVHTYDMIVLYGVTGSYWVWRLVVPGDAGEAGRTKARVGMFPAFVAISAPTVIYQWYVIHADPVYRAKAETLTASPPIAGAILGYGLLGVAAAAGILHVLRRRRLRDAFMLAWAAVGLAAPYLPLRYFPFQRKMFEGYHVALSLLASVAICAVVAPRLRKALGGRWTRTTCARAAAAAFVALTFPSNGCFVWMTLRDAVENGNAWRLSATNMPPLYLPRDEAAAMDWLRVHTSPSERVLSSFRIGSYIPAWSGNRVLWGHWAETTDLKEAGAIAMQFFFGRIPMQERDNLLARSKCDYVYFGRYERGLRNRSRALFDPRRLESLRLVHAEGAVEIYRIVGSGDQRTRSTREDGPK